MFPLLFGVVLIKHKFNTLLANVSWNIGNGECINFWNDAWCGKPLTSVMNIPSHLHSHLQATLDSCIQYFNWSVPQEILAFCPTLQDKLKLVTITKTYKEEELIWKLSHDGALSFKDAYLFQASSHNQNIGWAKVIWHAAIPPSKSLLVWRIPLNKLPTDDILAKRGCLLPFICSLCGKNQETLSHLFLECKFSTDIWSWLFHLLNITCNLTSFVDIIQIADRNWSPQCRLVVLSAIIYCFYTIWFCRNQHKFNDKI